MGGWQIGQCERAHIPFTCLWAGEQECLGATRDKLYFGDM